MAGFAKDLEDRARRLAGGEKGGEWDRSIPAMLQREISLTLDQIKRLRERHEDQSRRLLKIECYIDTELMQMNQRIPRYAPYHFPEKEKLRQRLFDIEKERRNLALRLQEKTQSLEDRLLSLLNKHQHLKE